MVGRTASAAVVIPAHNEAAGIRRLLDALAQDAASGALEVVVVCNGCSDETAAISRGYAGVRVVESPVPSKALALRQGDAHATAYPRLYVDADVELGADDVRALADAVRAGPALAAAPRRVLDMTGAPLLVRSYYRVWEQLPQVRGGIFGRGVIAMSEAAHRRAAALPDSMSDDLSVSEAFAPEETAIVAGATAVVRVPRRSRDLLRRRIRAHMGIAELDARGGRPGGAHTSPGVLARLARAQPSLAPRLPVFVGMALVAKAGARRRIRRGDFRWQRDESSRAQ